MVGSGLNLVTTVIGFGMSATFIVFVCARLICGRARSSASSRGGGQPEPFDFDIEFRAAAADLERQIEHCNGLEPVLVAAIPTMKYNREAFYSKEDAQCSICLGEYREKEVLRIMPTCQHNFHLSCIDVWLQKQSTCPICRVSLNNVSMGKSTSAPILTITQSVAHPESSGNRSAQWLPPSNHDTVHDSVNVLSVVIEVQPEVQELRT